MLKHKIDIYDVVTTCNMKGYTLSDFVKHASKIEMVMWLRARRLHNVSINMHKVDVAAIFYKQLQKHTCALLDLK